MDIETLRGFSDAVAYSSISEAARHIGISQQALSRRIIVLERELGCQLLDRESGVTPTSAGRIFLRYANEVLSLTDALVDDLGAATKAAPGTVKVKRYATDSFSRLMATVLKYREERFPQLQIEFVAQNEDDCLMVTDGSVDVSFIRQIVAPGLPAPDMDPADGLERIPLSSNSFPFEFIVPEGHPLLRIPQPTIADILAFRVAMPSFASKGAIPNAIRNLAERLGIPLRTEVVYCQSMFEYYSGADPLTVYVLNEVYRAESFSTAKRPLVRVSPCDNDYTVVSCAIHRSESPNRALPCFMSALLQADDDLAQ